MPLRHCLCANIKRTYVQRCTLEYEGGVVFAHFIMGDPGVLPHCGLWGGCDVIRSACLCHGLLAMKAISTPTRIQVAEIIIRSFLN